MDLPKNLSIELILDSDDEASSLSQKKNDEGDIENSSVKPPRPAFQYSKTIETKNPKEKVKLNLTAALACKTFTPYEYSKKVKALEALTGQRDHSVNPYCTVTVKGIKPQPYRVVKGFLIDSRIWIEKVANIQFVGDKTVFLVEKCYRRTFIHIIGNNPLITVIEE
ncbi:hypothetical protein AYI70_g8950 [Smittium culicis]|uniref:Uncharacterized protein n=1 Tax=Smittium culicis TaxID=133412 RepID=A0A1R1XDL6_9FUNG|nr:hypothetical protein AYI70_g8950 [Smittium culicis]